MLDLLGTHDIPYDKESFYAILFSIAVIILWVAFLRKRKNKDMEIPTSNNFVEIHQADILGQPITLMNNNQFPKEGVLFNTNSKSKLIPSIFITIGAFVIFGIIVMLLS